MKSRALLAAVTALGAASCSGGGSPATPPGQLPQSAGSGAGLHIASELLAPSPPTIGEVSIPETRIDAGPAVGPDGRAWLEFLSVTTFDEPIAYSVSSGFTQYSVASGIKIGTGISSGVNNDIWLAGGNGQTTAYVDVTTAGVMLGSINSSLNPSDLVAADGVVLASGIVASTTDAEIQELSPAQMTLVEVKNISFQSLSGDGAQTVWYLQDNGSAKHAIDSLNVSTDQTTSQVVSGATDFSGSKSLAYGNGKIYYTQKSSIGVYDPTTATFTQVPVATGRPAVITFASDGNLWFFTTGPLRIAKLTPPSTVTEYAMTKYPKAIPRHLVDDGSIRTMYYYDANSNSLGSIGY